MSDDGVFVGQDCGGRTVTVRAADVATYRTGTANPDLPDDPAPGLLYHSEVYRDLSWYLPNIIGNLHARQEWQLFHPLHVGDVVRTRSTVVERYRKRDRHYVVNEVLLTDADGRWLQRSRTHQSFLATDPAGETVVDRDRERRSDRRFTVPEGGGGDLPQHVRHITPAVCMAFSGPSLNYHTDRDSARALGFPDIVVQGMMTICFLADAMAERFGAGWYSGGQLDVRLVNVVWVDDRITTHGAIRERNPEGSRERVTLDVWATKADGTIAVIGTASAPTRDFVPGRARV